MKVVLAIDQSTSATKAILFDVRGKLLDKVSLPHQQHYPQPGWVEHDAEQIYANTLATIGQLLDRNKSLLPDILHLSITNQRETVVVFDRATGRPLYNAIVWQCRRGDAVCAQLRQAGYEERILKATGLKIDSYFPASKLKWLLDNKTEIRKQVAAGKAAIGTIDAYLIYRLTGGKVFATDATNASRTLLYDIGSLRWDADICGLFGVPASALPEVRPCDADYGATDAGGAIARGIPIRGVMGDSQAALFAQRCFAPGSAKVTFGTGSSILLNVGGNFVLPAGGVVTTVAWLVGGKCTYAFEGIINCTGATIAWLKDQLGLIADPAETETLARTLSDNGGVYLVPAFVGLGAPYWNTDARAAIVGLTQHSSRAHIARAALESIAYQVRDALEDMVAQSPARLSVVHGDGGMVANKFLMQLVADITGLPVRASALPELSALGAAFAGAIGAGEYRNLDELAALDLGSVEYRPAMPAQTVKANYDGWKRAVKRVL